MRVHRLALDDADHAAVRRVSPFRDESLASLLARSTRANVLNSTQMILEEVGLALAHPGTLGQELGGLANRLAEKIGCTSEDIAARTHPYADEREFHVIYGEALYRRSDLILDRRRISPAALRDEAYGRVAWQFRHLPYDPVTLELLLDRCHQCGKLLRWSRAWGIGTCEHCRADLTTHEPPRLRADMGDAYREFAALTLALHPDRAESIARLAPQLSKLTGYELADLVTAIGIALGSAPRAVGKRAIRHLEPEQRATAARCGTRYVRHWPTDFRSAVTEAWRKHELEGSADQLLRAVRSLGSEYAFGKERAALIRDALPEAFGDKRRALGSLGGPVVLAKDIARMAGVSTKKVAAARDADLLEASRRSGACRRHAQFKLEDARLFAESLRRSELCTRLEQWLGLPRYAIEQLHRKRAIEIDQHPGLLLLEPCPRITSQTMHALSDELEAAIIDEQQPTGMISLWATARRFGGERKAWGDILIAIAERKLSVYRSARRQSGPFAKRIVVSPFDLAEFRPGSFVTDRIDGAMCSTMMSQADACEILNLDPVQIRPVVVGGAIAFHRNEKALTTSMSSVLRYAEEMIPPAEVGPRLGVRNDAVHAAMRSNSAIPRIPGGWDRRSFDLFLPR